MPNGDLNAIVQRMIDAGESEDNIATVIRDYDKVAQTAAAPKDGTPSWLRAMETGTRGVTDAPANAVRGDEPTTWSGGFFRSLKDQTLKATAGNPALQEVARPQTKDDFLNLVLPDANVAGKFIATGIRKAPELVEKTGAFLRTVGRNARGVSLPSGLATMATGHRGVGAAMTAAPYLADGTGAVLERTGRALGRPVFEGPQAASQVDRWMPNVSTAERTIGPARQPGRVPYASPTEAVAQPVEGLDRYMANTSDAVSAAQAPSDLARVPYAAETPLPPVSEVGRLTSNRTPTLSETLTDAVQAARGQEPPMSVSHTPEVSITPSGRPGVTGQEYDAITQGAEQGRSVLVNPSSANRGGKLTGARATPQTMEEQIAAALLEKMGGEPPLQVSHPPQVELTPTGRPGVTGQEYDLITQQTESLPSKTRGDLRPDTASVSRPTPSSAPSAGGLSVEDKALLAKQGYTPEVIAKIEQQMGNGARPVASHAPVEPPINPDLQQPRIERGAERVGRQMGKTKEQIRMEAGPVLSEPRGEASMILPENVLEGQVQKMRAMPKDGPERAAHVSAARDPKTQAQLENLRRTLKSLGLATAGAAVIPDDVRQGLLQMMGQRSDR